MTTFQKITQYLKSRKTPASSWEIAVNTKSNHNTVRRVLGESLGNAFMRFANRKCTKTGKNTATYHLV